jgi:hypothetical protein
MYGRLVEVEGIDVGKREEILGIIRERIIPGLSEIQGFAGFISLVDEETAARGPWCCGRRRRARKKRSANSQRSARR